MTFSIRLLYLYLFSFVGLLILIIGSIRIIDLGIKIVFFPDADYYASMAPTIDGQPMRSQEEQEVLDRAQVKRNRQTELSGAVSMILIGLPVYLYHWKKINSEHGKSK